MRKIEGLILGLVIALQAIFVEGDPGDGTPSTSGKTVVELVHRKARQEIKLLSPKLDYMFKQIFGQEDPQSKEALKGLLEALLGINITDIQHKNTEIVPESVEDKMSRLDIRVTCNDTTEIDIEMQCRNTGEIPERAFHYLANMVPGTLKEGETYRKIKYISIWILGENVTQRKGIVNEARMCWVPNEVEGNYRELTDKARIIFVELKKVENEESMQALSKELQTWLRFFENPEEVEKSNGKGLKEAIEKLTVLSGDSNVREAYNERSRAVNDYNSAMLATKEEGREEGRKEGSKEKAAEIARGMLGRGLDIGLIADCTKLTQEEIEALKEEIEKQGIRP